MWRISIMSGIIKARATCCSFLQSVKTQSVKARCSVANGLGGSSNTTHTKPHEFFDHTRKRVGNLHFEKMPRLLRLQSPLVSCTDNGRFLALIKDMSGVRGKRLT